MTLTPDMGDAELTAHFREAGLSILHLGAVTRWSIADILAACVGSPERLAEGYREAIEEALCRVTLTPPEGGAF
ncbi:hypothetical protein ACI784_19040 [Geodermatophilus sp. SYSU D01186]